MSKAKPHILLVDDESSSRQILNRLLAERYQVTVLGNSEDCLEEALELQPDLILSDIIMPDLNGYELCEWLKANEKTCHIPIVLMSSLDSDSQREYVESAGAAAFLEKPVDSQMLYFTIEAVLS